MTETQLLSQCAHDAIHLNALRHRNHVYASRSAGIYPGDPANDVVGGTVVAGEAALASLNVSLCFFWPLSSGQSL